MTTSEPAARFCCLDLDTFFVSVERLMDPELIGKPVVVGGRGKRGVVTAASYEVRAFGVHSGMPMAQAVTLAPNAIYLPTRHGVYSPYSAKVRAILERYSPVVQTASIDEFFVDFRGCEKLYVIPQDRDADETIERMVWQMRDTVQSELGLPSSAGIAGTRTIAKIASGLAKPAGVLLVRIGDEEEFVRPLHVRKFPGIGPVTEENMAAAGIHTVGELLGLSSGRLSTRFAKAARAVRRAIDPADATGLGRDRPSFLEHDAHDETIGSISNERTFADDIGDPDTVRKQILALCERVCWRARKRSIRARTIALKLRHSDFKTLTRSKTLDRATNDERRIHSCVLQLLDQAWTRKLPIRLVGVALSNLEGHSPQLSLPFEEADPGSLGTAIDAVRSRFGYNAIRLGTTETSRWLERPDTTPLESEDDDPESSG